MNLNKSSYSELRRGRVERKKRSRERETNTAHSTGTRVEAKNFYIYGDYIETEEGDKIHYFPSLEEASEKYGVGYGTISKWSWRERWSLERSLFKKKIEDRKASEYEEEILSESTSFEKSNLDKLHRIHNLIDQKLDLMEARMESNEIGEEEEEKIDVDLRALESITKMLVETHRVVRNVTNSQKEFEIESSVVKQRDKVIQGERGGIKRIKGSKSLELGNKEYREEMLEQVSKVLSRGKEDKGVIDIESNNKEREERIKRIAELKKML